MENEYIPVDCGFADAIEAISTLRKPVWIRFRDPGGETRELHTRIVTTHVREHAEFAELENGVQIRFDHIITLDGKTPPTYC